MAGPSIPSNWSVSGSPSPGKGGSSSTIPSNWDTSGGGSSSGGSSGVFGLLGNLGSDVKGAVEGLPTGVETLLTHPVRAAQNIGKTYTQEYSPLFHGHFGQFAHEVYAHPLGPILDAATILTLGAGGAAKAGELLDSAGTLSQGSKLADLGKATDLTVPSVAKMAGQGGEDLVIKQSSRNPLIRLRQTTTNDLLNKLPSETPLLGSTSRGTRALMRQPERTAASLQGVAQKFSNDFNNLGAPERAAWHLNARAITPQSYVAHLTAQGEKVSPATLRLLNDPKLSQLMATPSAKLQTALASGRALSDHLTALKVAGGHIDEQTALEAPYRHLRVLNGAKYAPEQVATDSPALTQARAYADRLGAMTEREAAKQPAENLVPRHMGGAGDTADVAALRAAHSAALEEVQRLTAHAKTSAGEIKLTGGPSVETLMKRIDKQGGEQPFHVTDTAHAPGVRSGFSSRPSGFAAPAMGVKQSQGVLFNHGLINLTHNSLADSYRQFAQQARADMVHEELVKHAAEIPKGAPIPQGYEEIKLNRGQTATPFTQRVSSGFEHAMSEPTLKDRLSNLAAAKVPQASIDESKRFVVPSRVKSIVERGSGSPRQNIWRATGLPQATNLWKHLVLGLRPAFFANITAGNSILAALQMAPGRFGVAGWLNQVIPGAEKVFGSKLSAETMGDVFPEQRYGTFGHSMFGASTPSTHAIVRAGQKASQGVMPATIGYENVLRRAMAEGWAKATPEVQAVMRRNGGDVNEALREVAKAKPQIVTGISKRIDDALGNYRTYSVYERAIKAVVPFYGWNRHLTSSVARLALEHPARLDALMNTGKTGQAQAEAIVAGLPKYLAGSLGVKLPAWLGGIVGDKQLLTTSSLNPFNTLVDEGEMLHALGSSHPGSLLTNDSQTWPLNPIAQAAIEQATGTNLLNGRPLSKGFGNAIVNELEHATPQQQMLHDLIHGRHPGPKATNKNNNVGQLLRLLGLPVENVTP